ncbi:hypothetical protein [Agrobacterium tumefaciens]|uniref:hypothetical protein n=1 Tax=Agrobacterium tumefaciens TaxID=358 RepID=UPI001147537F|nr:hypothetical protein [Agrobacterium tumefaciens]NSL22848.1 hypothetical protein [Agrobacterium tumefaciens]NTC56765.1 hypothetical protein [Agrobacterium tumefaciens]NTC62581.1 hypothetical protein [Agrobacterium tumefaciens]NTC66311.1 hypothetical protein [Agrobacterium tumefaciens]NTC74891.1 hypothetical protein [Agrobacterium tumefaciens]
MSNVLLLMIFVVLAILTILQIFPVCSPNASFAEWMQSIEWLEWTKVTFDLAKGVAWPLSLFSLVWLFRDQIRARIPFMVQVGPTGAVFQGVQQTTAPGESATLNVSSEFVTVSSAVKNIRVELEGFIAEHREGRLINALAEARVFANFEFIFGAIFQTQIDFLSALEKGAKTTDESQALFNDLTARLNKEFIEWGFVNWVNFLRVNELIDTSTGEFSITQKGRDFVLFVRKYRLGVIRPN